MSRRHAALTALLGILTVLLLPPQLLSQGIAYGHPLPIFHAPHVPLPYLYFRPVPAVRLGFPYEAHVFPYMLGHPWIVPHIGYPIVRERIIIREYIPEQRPHRHRHFPRIDFWLLALKEGPIYAVADYWLEDETLHYVRRDGTKSSVLLEEVDLTFSKRLNRRLGIPFRLPPFGP